MLGPDGALVVSSPGLPSRPLLAVTRLRDAAEEGIDVRLSGIAVDADDSGADEIDLDALEETGAEPFETDRARVRAAQVTLPDGRYTIVTGATYEDIEEAMAGLDEGLLIVAPLALLLIGLAGWVAVGRALRPLHAALAHERQLVADVSHELRTPLAVISGELELARSAPDRAEAEESIEVAQQEARRLARIGEDLLLLARADAARLELRREPLAVAELLEQTRRRFATSGAVTVEAPAGLTVVADRLRVEQALGNLIDNAFAHGGGAVTVHAAAEGERVAFTVADDGPGFPEPLLRTAFERFAKGREGRTGLGLAIVEVVATAHGGRVAVANRPGGGAAVTFTV